MFKYNFTLVENLFGVLLLFKILVTLFELKPFKISTFLNKNRYK